MRLVSSFGLLALNRSGSWHWAVVRQMGMCTHPPPHTHTACLLPLPPLLPPPARRASVLLSLSHTCWAMQEQLYEQRRKAKDQQQKQQQPAGADAAAAAAADTATSAAAAAAAAAGDAAAAAAAGSGGDGSVFGCVSGSLCYEAFHQAHRCFMEQVSQTWPNAVKRGSCLGRG